MAQFCADCPRTRYCGERKCRSDESDNLLNSPRDQPPVPFCPVPCIGGYLQGKIDNMGPLPGEWAQEIGDFQTRFPVYLRQGINRTDTGISG